MIGIIQIGSRLYTVAHATVYGRSSARIDACDANGRRVCFAVGTTLNALDHAGGRFHSSEEIAECPLMQAEVAEALGFTPEYAALADTASPVSTNTTLAPQSTDGHYGEGTLEHIARAMDRAFHAAVGRKREGEDDARG